MAFFDYCDCDGCEEHASLYKVTIPNHEHEYCSECGVSKGGLNLVWSFCSLKCLKEFVKDSLHKESKENPQ